MNGTIAFALAAGMAATVNPCGFALLPAYLSAFVGLDDDGSGGKVGAVRRALTVSAALTAGFVLVFGLFGLIVTPLALRLERSLPWVTIVIGIGLVGIGVALLAGRQLVLSIPKLNRGGRDGTLPSMFLFGISYAVASLSCTIGPFLAVTTTTFRSDNWLAGLGVFVAYGVGMGIVITTLTVAVALAKSGLIHRIRGVVPKMNRVAGGLLVVAGAYVAYYGWYEIRVLRGSTRDPIVDRAIALQNWLQRTIVPDDPLRVATIAVLVIATLVVATSVIHRRRRRQPRRSGRRPLPDSVYTRRRLLVAGFAAALPVGALALLRETGGGAGSTPDARPSAPTPSPSTVPDHVTATPRDPAGDDEGRDATALDHEIPPLGGNLALGMVNDDVAVLQQRLSDLAFAPGPVDGWFGEATLRAVWAFDKLVLGTARQAMTGLVTGEYWGRLHHEVSIRPRRSTNRQADHTEIYLPEQVIIVFHRDEPVLVSHMSSGELDADGEPAEWCGLTRIDIDERGYPLDEPIMRDVCGRAKTPGGVFTYDRRVEGIRRGALGAMWDPVYFNFGIAVHGSPDVPAHPVSKGCVRIPMHISEHFFGLVSMGDRVLVWDGRTEPEQMSEQDMLPVFDYPNPDATTTTSTTTTTTTTTSTTTSSTPASSSTSPP